jgi:hypothetical protein
MAISPYRTLARGVVTRLWRQFPSYLLASVLIGIGVLMLLPSAPTTMAGGWRWVFLPPGPIVWGWGFIALGALHAVAWYSRWRVRYGTLLALFPAFVLIAVKLYITVGVSPGSIIYPAVAMIAIWLIRWHQLFD